MRSLSTLIGVLLVAFGVFACTDTPVDPANETGILTGPSEGSFSQVPFVGCNVSFGVVEKRQGHKVTYTGTDGDDNFFCWDASQGVIVNAGKGNDVIGGSNYDDELNGGPGCDRILARDGDDFIDLGPGDDNEEACSFGGGHGQLGNDYLHGGSGDDLLDGGEVVGDVCEGGKGIDVYVNCAVIKDPDCVKPPAGMVGWWPGDGNADDIVGGNDGTLQNGATFGSGNVGRAFRLDGEDDFVSVPHTEDLNFGTNDFTVDFWVYFRSIEGEQIMVEKWIQAPGNPVGWTFTKIDGWIRFAFSNITLGEYDIDFDPGDIPTNSWIHVAATRAGNTYSMFWNGELIVSDPNAETYDLDSNSSLKFGHRGNPDDTPGSVDEGGFYLNGLIDEVEIFDRALSTSEIKAIYDSGSKGKCKL